jgi:hypothetical protein
MSSRPGHLFPAVTFGAAALLFALLTLGDKMHFIAVYLGNALGNHTLIKTTDQLVNRFAVASLDFHAAESPALHGLNYRNV